MMSGWRAALERKHGRDTAHKTLRVWRAFWKIMLGMKTARTADPSTGIRNQAPPPRWQRWAEGETVRLVKAAWRQGYHGLACIIAVAWDTGFSPVDVRSLAARHRAFVGGRLIFDRQADGRTKTGRAAIGTLSIRTERLVTAYLDHSRLTSTLMRHCSARGQAMPTAAKRWAMISRQCAAQYSPTTGDGSWICAVRVRWRLLLAVQDRSASPPSLPTQSVDQTRCTRPTRPSILRRCAALTTLA